MAEQDKTTVIPAESDPAAKTILLIPGNETAEAGAFSASGTGSEALFSQYTICGKIGDGGMGVVYLARDRRLGRYVAIKRLNEQALQNPVLRQRFLYEARAVAVLNHVHVVHIYALGEDELGPYIVMEYVAGPPRTEVYLPEAEGERREPRPGKSMTLEQLVNAEGAMAQDDAIAMIMKIARTIAYAHGCGVIHRDLKPANILLDVTREPKIVDFGLARLERTREEQDAGKLTVPGEKLLSMGYSAPELEQDASTSDTRADVYSIGAIFYFLLTGRNPRYYREQDVPPALREILKRALANQREERFQTVDAFVHALSEVIARNKVEMPTVKTVWRCKWCDAVNPLSTRFCGECGWEGMEHCAECNAEIFVGMQYCGSCGADARLYEHVLAVKKQIEEAWEKRRFERVVTLTSQIHGFEPAGPSGRKLLKNIMSQRDAAEKSIARRDRLATLIPAELKAENYERAQAFIDEFRQLNENSLIYEDELRRIPEAILKRDIARIWQYIRNRDWETARRLCDTLRPAYVHTPEYAGVRAAIDRHAAFRKLFSVVSLLIALFMVYFFSAPLVARFSGGHLGSFASVVYRPIQSVYTAEPLAPFFSPYVRFLNLDYSPGEMFSTLPEAPADLPRQQTAFTDDVLKKKSDFERELRRILETVPTVNAMLLGQYSEELRELTRRRQEAGDYDTWVAATQLVQKPSGRLDPPLPDDVPAIAELKKRFIRLEADHRLQRSRQLVGESKKYTSLLSEVLKEYTRDGRAELASVINDEIKRVKNMPELVEAEAQLAEAAKNAHGNNPMPVTPQTDVYFDVLRKHRQVFEKELADENNPSAEALRQWPVRYDQALRVLMDEFQQWGDFNGWESVSIERSRFEADRVITTDDLVVEPEKLADVQRGFLKQYTENHIARAKNVIECVERYIANLEKLQRELTVKGEMAGASAVNTELRRVRQLPDYLSAQNQVAPPRKEAPAAKPQ